MNPNDRERLVKLLRLSASDVDAEAVSAIRTAHRLLQQLNTDWDEIVVDPRQVTSSATQQEAAAPSHTRPTADFSTYATPEYKIDEEKLTAFYFSPKETAATAFKEKLRAIPKTIRFALFPAWIAAEIFIEFGVAQPTWIKCIALLISCVIFAALASIEYATLSAVFSYLLRAITFP